MKKKIWEKPKLIVLVRSRPEEVILTRCKYTGHYNGPASADGGCKSMSCDNCTSCSDLGPS